MIPEHPAYVSCPLCSETLERFQAGSTTLDLSVSWSDSYAEYLDDISDHLLRKCGCCGGVYYAADAVNMAEPAQPTPRGVEQLDSLYRCHLENKPSQADYLYALENRMARSAGDEIEFLKRVWWYANDRIRQTVLRIEGKVADQGNDVDCDDVAEYVAQVERFHKRVNERISYYAEHPDEALTLLERWLQEKAEFEISLEQIAAEFASDLGMSEDDIDKDLASLSLSQDSAPKAVHELRGQEREEALRQAISNLCGIPLPTPSPEARDALAWCWDDLDLFKANAEKLCKSIEDLEKELQRFQFSDLEKKYLNRLEELLRGVDQILHAELLRELGKFRECLILLRDIDGSEEEQMVVKMIRKAALKETRTAQVVLSAYQN